MIYASGHEVIGKHYGKHALASVYYGLRLVWEAANSCFTSCWRNAKGWKDTAAWKNR